MRRVKTMCGSMNDVQSFIVLRPFIYERENGYQRTFTQGQTYELLCRRTIVISGNPIPEERLTYRWIYPLNHSFTAELREEDLLCFSLHGLIELLPEHES